MPITDFTYSAYGELMDLIVSNGYSFASYHDYSLFQKPCIMRHDVDMDIRKALQMAEFEAKHRSGVRSTYFVLLKTDFYNPASANSLSMMTDILNMGHQIGLHFDEMAYQDRPDKLSVTGAIKNEAQILSEILEYKVQVVSMHRPSKETLESNYQLDGLVNSYDRTFFQEFKYLSDSRHFWRENPEEVISSGEHERIHLLTHPIWYTEKASSAQDVMIDFLNGAKRDRYMSINDNVRDFEEMVGRYQE